MQEFGIRAPLCGFYLGVSFRAETRLGLRFPLAAGTDGSAGSGWAHGGERRPGQRSLLGTGAGSHGPGAGFAVPAEELPQNVVSQAQQTLRQTALDLMNRLAFSDERPDEFLQLRQLFPQFFRP